MKKIIFKPFNLFFIISIIFITFVNVPSVYAKTINDLTNELNALEAKAKSSDNQIKYTEAQIAQANKDIVSISADMSKISKEIVAKTNEIADLGDQIDSKHKETDNLMQYIQISNGDPFYMKYVMGADSLTDLIYRIAVTEQLSKYNSDLITKMDQMIKDNEARKVELNDKTVELGKKQVELGESLKVLSSQKTKLYEDYHDIEAEIAASRSVIQMYKDKGCKNDEDISSCASGLLPADTKFWRPRATGVLTSGFGYRTYYNGSRYVSDYHEGFDMSNSDRYNTKVYAVASGMVAKFTPEYVAGKRNPGGNEVVIHHQIISGGTIKYYSSTYAHLATVFVRDGDLVTKDTVIGIMGSTGNSTGPHLHLAISTGLRYRDYVSYDAYVAHCFEPSDVINFPPMGRYWFNRVTRY